jgi:hypothetical protein
VRNLNVTAEFSAFAELSANIRNIPHVAIHTVPVVAKFFTVMNQSI